MKRTPNPFKPTAGKNPPELIGRSDVLLEFEEALQNGPGAPGCLMRISGIRGMGKTVMLNELGALASQAGWIVLDETASGPFTQRMSDRLSGTDWSHAVVEPEVLGVKIGSLQVDKPNTSLQDILLRFSQGPGLLITLDEVQDASLEETKALAIAIQHVIRKDGNIAFVFAGLPSMVEGVVNSESLTFLRRAVPFTLGPLETYQIFDSLGDTFRSAGMGVDDPVVDCLARATGGYPFMVQLVGYHTWQQATRRGGRRPSPKRTPPSALPSRASASTRPSSSRYSTTWPPCRCATCWQWPRTPTAAARRVPSHSAWASRRARPVCTASGSSWPRSSTPGRGAGSASPSRTWANT